MAKENKSQIQGIEGVSGAIKKLTEVTKLLNAEQKKQIETIKKADEANVKLSEDVAKVGKLYTGVQKNIEELTKTQLAYNQNVSKARQALLNSTEKVVELEKELAEVQTKRKNLEKQIAEAEALEDEATKTRLETELEKLKKLETVRQNAFNTEKSALQGIVREYDKQIKKVDILNDSVKEHTKAIEEAEKAYEEYKKNSDEAFQTSGHGIERTTLLLKGMGDHLNELSKMSSLSDIVRNAESFAGSLNKVGSNLVMMQGGFSKFGGFISSIGKGMGAMLGPISAIISIAEILMGAEKDQKDFNKSILESGGALQFMTKETDSLHENLNILRKGMLDADNLLSLGMSADEIKSSLASLQDMNITLEEMGGRGSDITRQFEGARNVIGEMKTISAVFGVGIDEVTAHIESLHGTLGRTLDDAEELKEIKTSFDLIRDAASQAGYSNKKFFSTVISVTNEVANMSGRITEAGALFKNLRKLLGKKGEEVLELGKEGYKGKGLQDRYTDVKKVGEKNVSKILQREAMAKSIALFKGEGGLYGDTQAGKIGSYLKGVDFAKLKSGDADAIKQLTKMSAEDRKTALEKIRRDKDLGADVANQIQDLFTLTKGIGANAQVQARSIEKLGLGGNFAMLAGKLNFIGKSADKLADLDLDSAVNQKLLEDTYGADKANAMKDLLTRGKEDFAYFSKIAKKGDKATEEEKKELKEAGFKSGEKGQLLAAGTGKAIGDLTEFVQAMPERFSALEDMAESAKTQEELLQESIDATVSSSEALATILKEKLDFLGDYTSWIFSWLSGSSEEEKQNKIEQQNKLKSEVNARQESLSESKKLLKSLEEQSKKEKDPIKQKALAEDIKKTKEGIEAEKQLIGETKGRQSAFRKSAVKDLGTAENVRRFEEARDTYNMTQGDDAAKLKAVGEKHGGWAVEELKARETLRKSTDSDDQDKLKEIERGEGGGSAFEEMKAREAEKLQKARKTRGGRHGGGYASLDEARKDIEKKYEDRKFKSLDTSAIGALDELKKKKADEKKAEEEKVEPKVEQEKAAILVKEERKEDEKNKAKDQKEQVETLVKADDETRKKQEAETKASAVQYLIEDAKAKNKTLSAEDADKLYEAHKVTSNPVVQAAIAASSATPTVESSKDMILSDKGAFSLDSKDQVVAMKTGGAIDQFLKGGGGRGNVTININGGDEARIFEVVKKAMSTAGVVTQGMK